MCLTSDRPNLYEDPQRPGYKTPVRCGPDELGGAFKVGAFKGDTAGLDLVAGHAF